MGKSTTPTTMVGKVEKYLMRHKKIAVGDAEEELNIRPDQLYRVIYELRALGYPITSSWVSTDDGVHFVIYSIPAKWSRKLIDA